MPKGEFLFDDGDTFHDNPLVDNLGKGSLSAAVFPVGLARGRREGLVVVVVLSSWLFGNELLLERPLLSRLVRAVQRRRRSQQEQYS